MKIEQEFTLPRPRSDVWAFFHDVPAVASCLPGAEYLGEKEPGSHSGRMSMKVGPFQASFEGVADVTYDEAAHFVSMSGKGVDKRGASRGRMTMNCGLEDEAGGTRVRIDADVQLSGSIAQFGRTGIIEEIASTLISDFVANVENVLPAAAISEVGADASPSAPPQEPSRSVPRRELSGTRLLWISIRNWVRSLFGTKSR
jgi:carbon-monoxide dehydrogenase small subunit